MRRRRRHQSGNVPAPVNTVAPTIAEPSDAVGQTITVTLGTWTNSPTLTHQWQRDGADIAGQTGLTYTDAHADDGTTTRCLEIPNGNRALAVASNGLYHPILSYDFSATASPLAAPTEGQRGYLRVVDTVPVMSSGSGVGLVSGTPAASAVLVNGDVSNAAVPLARIAGRFMRLKIPVRTTVPTGCAVIGWNSSVGSVIDYGTRYATTSQIQAMGFNTPNNGPKFSPGSGTHEQATVLFAAGAATCVRNDTGTPRLLWVYPDGAAAEYPVFFPNNSGAQSYTMDDFYVGDQSTLVSLDQLATLKQVTPISGTRYVGEASGIHWLSFTLPAVSANLVAVELRIRMVDANNYDYWRIKGNAGGTAWDGIFGKVIAGVDTPIDSAATGIGTPDYLVMQANASTIDKLTHPLSGGKMDYRGTQQTLSLNNTEVGVGCLYDASVTNLTLWSFSFTPAALSALF